MDRKAPTPRAYIAIDLKSFYASVECAARNLDPMTTNLVVADLSRTEKTICLAVSPSLRAWGIPGRARLFEVIQKVDGINAERLRTAVRLGLALRDPDTGKPRLAAPSNDAEALAADPSLELSYIVAPPRMKLYEKISTQIFSIYAKYISPEDIHVYSIDECFLDVTAYLKTYGTGARELAMRMIRDVLRATGITATAGIGTNMYLAKVAMDIVAKHVPADTQGVRIAELDETRYRELLWCHRPLTDFWRVGRGSVRRLEKLACFTMGDIARLSVQNEARLYSAFGINAELLIDHAWGWEPTEISAIKAYRPENRSVSAGQILKEPYSFEQAKRIVREMTEGLALDLLRKGIVTRQVTLTINYDRTSIIPARPGAADSLCLVASTGRPYAGKVTTDFYGRTVPGHAHGSENLSRWTSSASALTAAMTALYTRITDRDLTVRRITVGTGSILPEKEIPEEAPEQLDLFTDYAALERMKAEQAAAEARERKLQQAALSIQDRFGRNMMLKGASFLSDSTLRERNEMIGGHRAGDDGDPPSLLPETAEDEAAAESAPDAFSPDASETKPAPRFRESAPSVPGRAVPAPVPRSPVGNGPDARKVYADIIGMPHWQSPVRPHMSLQDRAAQFSSYKALSGYEDMVAEEARLTEEERMPEEYDLELLDRKLNRIAEALDRGIHPECTFTVFVPDEKKAGGRYTNITASVKRLDLPFRKIVLIPGPGESARILDFDRITAISGAVPDGSGDLS